MYFDAATRERARELREAIRRRFGPVVEIGRFHERPVGPHPKESYQIAFAPAQLYEVLGWLALNHADLDVFVHPNTGDPLRDHRDSALWLGHSHVLDLRAVGG